MLDIKLIRDQPDAVASALVGLPTAPTALRAQFPSDVQVGTRVVVLPNAQPAMPRQPGRSPLSGFWQA